jgi:ribosomal protein S27AE
METKYQQLRKAGLCTRNCGRKGALANHQKNAPRRAECRKCYDTTHGKK